MGTQEHPNAVTARKRDDTDGKKEKTKREIQKAALLSKYLSVSLVPA